MVRGRMSLLLNIEHGDEAEEEEDRSRDDGACRGALVAGFVLVVLLVTAPQTFLKHKS